MPDILEIGRMHGVKGSVNPGPYKSPPLTYAYTHSLVLCFNQHLGAACTQKLVKILFCHFQFFWSDVFFINVLRKQKNPAENGVFSWLVKVVITQTLVDSSREFPILSIFDSFSIQNQQKRSKQHPKMYFDHLVYISGRAVLFIRLDQEGEEMPRFETALGLHFF